MPAKLTAAQFIDRSNVVHGIETYDYSEVVYTNQNTKVKIGCLEHGPFWQIPKAHMNEQGCPTCGSERAAIKNSLTQDEFLQRARVVHGDTFLYEMVKYVDLCTKVEITCRVHGNFWQTPTMHLEHGCRKCVADELRMTKEEFIQKSTIAHGTKYDYEPVVLTGATNKSKVKIGCPTHGIFEQVASDHMGGHGCSECGFEATAKSLSMSAEEFIVRADLVHGGGAYDYSRVVIKNSQTEVEIGCAKHGYFWQKPEYHLGGSGCPICGKAGTSHMERVWLDTHSIPREHRQYRIKIGSKNFKVDGFDPTTNTVYEYYGDYWHGNPLKFDPNDVNESTGQTFGDLYQATLQREFLLRSHGYTLIIKWQTEPVA